MAGSTPADAHSAHERHCPSCGARVRATARFCGRCQAALRPPSPAPRPRRRRRVLPALLVVLAVVGAAGALLELRGGAALLPATGAPASRGAPAATAAPVQPTAGDVAPTASATRSPAQPDAAEVLDAVQGHWEAIREHRFDEAYAYLGPRLATGQSTWVSSHEQDGISDVQYEFSVREVSGDTATVDIVTLRTWARSAQSAADPTGCLSWSGDYVLTRDGGRWLLSQANITATPC